MSRGKKRCQPEVPEPVDVVDGIPDHARTVRVRSYVMMAAVFLAWLVFLFYAAFAGRPGS